MAEREAGGLLDYLQENFQYRYNSMNDYLARFERPGQRTIDLGRTSERAVPDATRFPGDACAELLGRV